ncbi:mucoidy inhibitor MuiA family protein [Abyssalbus ytuae]|uniref:Mucoidy inhibitor MuiA family protein n=1 Tax=Abyssalbus ytuae TaxID=2926907 RepID=A0A9E7D1T3_9FLAO|nr:mucoidy inhibitor MuiA family protein [Abyssalbus ytuae]UOB17438.1 mucoidy inhibitor MuiA family protein [Abyssalbus ytuae]
MKNIFLLILLLTHSFLFSNEKGTPSTIEKVVVYLNGAQIIRTSTLSLKSGTTVIIFNDLSPNIDENSIQVSGLGDVSILSLQYDINYLEKKKESDEIENLITRIKLFEKKIAYQKNRIKGLQEEKTLLVSNRKLVNETHTVSLVKIQEFSKYYRSQVETIHNAVFEAEQTIDSLENELGALKKQLEKFKNHNKEKRGEITLNLDAPVNANIHLKLKYNVSSAGWFPVYDIKTQSIDHPLSLHYRAHVYQKTGTDWENTKIVLSTKDPTINNENPELNTHFLNFINKYSAKSLTNPVRRNPYRYNPMVKRVAGKVLDETGMPLPGANVIIKGTSTGTLTNFEGEYEIEINEGNTLVFSYIGFLTEELPVYSSIMNIKLKEDYEALEEVVVTGYGINKKRNPKGSLASNLGGKAPGITIRGSSTTKMDKTPFYIVDGMMVDDISYLDENEIVTIETLDDTASSMYGSQAENGVIVITTKGYTINKNIITKEFNIKKPYNIASAKDVTVIDIDKFDIPAEYRYLAAPVINENVFLLAEISNWENFDLLPGEANIYFDGSYAGKTFIDPLKVEKKLKVSLGADPNIIVSRRQLNNFKDKNFTGSLTIINKTYELVLKNNKPHSVEISLLDRIPVSQNKEIKVDDIEYSNAYYDDKKGIVKWKITLQPSEGAKKTLSYEVKYPKWKKINL